jgi:hypothetical protein
MIGREISPAQFCSEWNFRIIFYQQLGEFISLVGKKAMIFTLVNLDLEAAPRRNCNTPDLLRLQLQGLQF